MKVCLTATERQQGRALQTQRRDDDGYGKATVVLLLDAGRSAPTGAPDLGLDEATVYRYAEAFARLGRAKYRAHEPRGYGGLLPSTQLAGRCPPPRQPLDTHWRPSPTR